MVQIFSTLFPDPHYLTVTCLLCPVRELNHVGTNQVISSCDLEEQKDGYSHVRSCTSHRHFRNGCVACSFVLLVASTSSVKKLKQFGAIYQLKSSCSPFGGGRGAGPNIYIRAHQLDGCVAERREGQFGAAERPLTELNVLKESGPDSFPHRTTRPQPQTWINTFAVQ